MSIVIIDCGSGNLFSVAKAMLATAPKGKGEGDIIVSNDAADLARAERIILPGQGAFARCFQGLAARPGLIDMLEKRVIGDGVPFLGICVGMQLMVERGYEHGEFAGLGWIKGSCTTLAASKTEIPLKIPHMGWPARQERSDDPSRLSKNSALKIPHMGWNDMLFSEKGKKHPVLQGLSDGDHAYFVHSYAVTGCPKDNILATTDYGGAVTAIIGHKNMIGTQFHVEKSQKLGLHILHNFWHWDGKWQSA